MTSSLPPVRPPRIRALRLAQWAEARSTSLRDRAAKPPDATTTVTLSPDDLFPTAGARRAVEAIGGDAYALLRTLALEGWHILHDAVANDDKLLREVLEEPPAGNSGDAGARVYRAATVAHWQVLAHLAIAIERLTSLASAVQLHRAGQGLAAGRQLVDHPAEPLSVLGAGRLHTPEGWRAVGGVPRATELEQAGLSSDAAFALDAEAERWAAEMASRWVDLSSFYTRDVHRVFLGFKHGFSLVSPRVAEIKFALSAGDLADVRDDLTHGFAVLCVGRDGSRWLQVVRSDPDELRNALRAADRAIAGLRSLSMAWLLELEHPAGRAFAFRRPSDERREPFQRGVREWLGADLDPVYAEVFAESVAGA
jgi:hypothetical protein